MEAGWYAEYQYRHMFPGITHAQYLDEVTMEEVQWMVRIHRLVQEAEARESEKS